MAPLDFHNQRAGKMMPGHHAEQFAFFHPDTAQTMLHSAAAQQGLDDRLFVPVSTVKESYYSWHMKMMVRLF